MKLLRQAGFVSFLVLSFFVLSCASTSKPQTESPASSDQGERALYTDFDDILVPSGMKLDKKESFVYGTSRSRVGILIYDGRVDPASLADFFQNNMQKDGWRMISSFKYREYLLTFVKEDRACVISIVEKLFSTMASIRVGPIEPVAAKGK
jgi:hypothetical protein